MHSLLLPGQVNCFDLFYCNKLLILQSNRLCVPRHGTTNGRLNSEWNVALHWGSAPSKCAALTNTRIDKHTVATLTSYSSWDKLHEMCYERTLPLLNVPCPQQPSWMCPILSSLEKCVCCCSPTIKGDRFEYSVPSFSSLASSLLMFVLWSYTKGAALHCNMQSLIRWIFIWPQLIIEINKLFLEGTFDSVFYWYIL